MRAILAHRGPDVGNKVCAGSAKAAFFFGSPMA
jgi:hypothetical protein